MQQRLGMKVATLTLSAIASLMPSIGLSIDCDLETGFDVVDVPLPTQGTIAFSGDLGDGFEPLPLGRRVFNIWHHNHSKVQCSEMVRRAGVEGSQVCEGYGTESSPGYRVRVGGKVPRTSNANVGYADKAANRIIYPAALQSRLGFVCLETPPHGPPSLCPASNKPFFSVDGFIEVESGGTNLGWGSADYERKKLYAVDWLTPHVYCLDVSDPVDLRPCAGFPYSEHGFGTLRASVMPKTTRVILIGYWKAACMDTGTQPPSQCAGWPSKVSTAGNLVGEPIPVMDASGVAVGFCQYHKADSVKCYHITNGSAAEPGTQLAAAGLKFQSLSMQNVSNAPHKNDFSHISFFQTRTYFAVGAFDTDQGVICYDGKTQDLCPNFPHAVNVKSGIYGVAADVAVNGTCIWSLGHGGILESFSAADPSQPCGSDQPVVPVIPGCAAMEWRALRMSSVAFKYFDSVQVSVMGTDGVEVKTGVLIDGTALSLVGLPVAGVTAELIVKMDFVDHSKELDGEGSDPVKVPQLTVEWEGCESQCHSSSTSMTVTETRSTTVTGTATGTTVTETTTATPSSTTATDTATTTRTPTTTTTSTTPTVTATPTTVASTTTATRTPTATTSMTTTTTTTSTTTPCLLDRLENSLVRKKEHHHHEGLRPGHLRKELADHMAHQLRNKLADSRRHRLHKRHRLHQRLANRVRRHRLHQKLAAGIRHHLREKIANNMTSEPPSAWKHIMRKADDGDLRSHTASLVGDIADPTGLLSTALPALLSVAVACAVVARARMCCCRHHPQASASSSVEEDDELLMHECTE